VRRWATLIGLVTLAGGGHAHGFVRSTTQDGTAALYWKESCVPLTIYVNGFDTSAPMEVNQIVKSIAAAAHTWAPDGVSCANGGTTYLEIVPTLSTATTAGPVGYDARNSLVFRTENWTMGGKANGTPYAFEALAVTTVIARGDGHIVDTDMEINGVTKAWRWMNLDPGVRIPDDPHGIEAVFDLQNALTHEFGHLIGLDHTCFVFDPGNPKVRPKDDMGKDVPDCDGAPGDVQTTVMFNKAPPGETSKRTLAPDDTRAVCEIYAASNPHEACLLDQPNTGCAIVAPAPRRPSRGAPVLALTFAGAAAVVAAGLRRRARRR
jgi:hypothetical protein